MPWLARDANMFPRIELISLIFRSAPSSIKLPFRNKSTAPCRPCPLDNPFVAAENHDDARKRCPFGHWRLLFRPKPHVVFQKNDIRVRRDFVKSFGVGPSRNEDDDAPSRPNPRRRPWKGGNADPAYGRAHLDHFRELRAPPPHPWRSNPARRSTARHPDLFISTRHVPKSRPLAVEIGYRNHDWIIFE